MQDNIFLTEHFCLKEFTESATARKHGIVNEAPPEAVENLKRLCEGCLEPLREKLGLPVIITSGYRCQRLNEILVHAARKSQHMEGRAADFVVQGSKFKVQGGRELLVKAFKTILLDPTIDYDQVILYPSFIHVSYVSKERNRHGILKANSNGKLGYGRLTLSNALLIE